MTVATKIIKEGELSFHFSQNNELRFLLACLVEHLTPKQLANGVFNSLV